MQTAAEQKPQQDHHRTARYELPSVQRYRILRLRVPLDQSRTQCAADHRQQQSAFAGHCDSSPKTLRAPVHHHDTQNSEDASDPFGSVHGLIMKYIAGDQDGYESSQAGNDRSLHADRVCHPDVEQHILTDRLCGGKLQDRRQVLPLRQSCTLQRKRADEHRDPSRKKETAASEQNL